MKLVTLLSPQHCYHLATKARHYFLAIFLFLFTLGLVWGLYIAPADFQQGEGYRIIYIHVPSAFMAMGVYMLMATMACVFLIWRIKIAAICLKCSAQIGAWFAFLSLFTGSVWGKPMWGTWWIWDARLTSALILFFIYLGIITLQSAVREQNASDKASALLVLIGVVNIPIIHFSVVWWNTLHQGATISRLGSPSIAKSMMFPLLVMIFTFFVYYLFVMTLRVRTEILRRENGSSWVVKWVKEYG